MSPARTSVPGATRVCPHCRATILESVAVCPACRHHLRFEPGAVDRGAPGTVALQVDGTIEHPGGDPWEFCVLLTIRNERGEEVTRHVAGVGVLHATDRRSFTVAVEVFKPGDRRLAR